MTYSLETYGDIGAMLRDVRESRGLSLKQAAHALNLRDKYVAALEEGDFEALPGRIYARGYIRNYALLLGLDAETLTGSFAAAGPRPAPERLPFRAEGREFMPRGWLVAASCGAALLLLLLLSGGPFSGPETQYGVRPVPADLQLQHRNRQEHMAALPDCFRLLLASRPALCYYRREIRRAALLPKWRFSAVLTLQTVSGRI